MTAHARKHKQCTPDPAPSVLLFVGSALLAVLLSLFYKP